MNGQPAQPAFLPGAEARSEDSPWHVPDPVIENARLLAQKPARAPDTCVPAGPARWPAPVEPGTIQPPAYKPFHISTPAPGETDVFASFASSFILVAPGAFLMGSPDCEPGRGGDETLHEVTITKPFFIRNAPVTQGLWKAVMGANPSSFQEDGDDLPVESVSWNQCREFIGKLNSTRDVKCRLPTEAEWEYACRAASTSAFATGDISEQYCDRDPVLWEMGWYCGNSARRTQPVSRKNPNTWGLFDMHGNVGEWCLDWYGDYHADPASDPLGPKSGSGKVVRGGSWFGNAKNCRSAARFHWPPSLKSALIGFRLVREPS